MRQKVSQQTKHILRGTRIRAAGSKIISFLFKKIVLAQREKTAQVKVTNNNIYLEQSIQQQQQLPEDIGRRVLPSNEQAPPTAWRLSFGPCGVGVVGAPVMEQQQQQQRRPDCSSSITAAYTFTATPAPAAPTEATTPSSAATSQTASPAAAGASPDDERLEQPEDVSD